MAPEKMTLHCKMCPFAHEAEADDMFAMAGGCDRVCFYITIMCGKRTPLDRIPEEMRESTTVH